MTEQQLIQKIKELKQIKPKQEWVILCKEQILEKAVDVRHQPFSQPFSILDIFRVPLLKPAILSITCVMVLVGVFGLVQNTLPGDTLYTAKKATEQAQFNLTSKQEKPKMALELTNEKLQELSIVAEANLGKNLAPAIKEVEQAYQATAQAYQLATQEINQKVSDISAIDKEQIEMYKEVKEQNKRLEQTLAVKMEISELDESINSYYDALVDYKALVEQEITALENQTLTTEQEQVLNEIQQLFDKEKYDQAFEKLLLSQ